MTRRENRRMRREAVRELRREEQIGKYDSFDQVTDLDHLYDGMKKCARGVRWKHSVQIYLYDGLFNIRDIRIKLLNQEDIRRGFVLFVIYERGKLRRIYSVHIAERVPQRVLCDRVLVPIIERSIISDNCASMRGKGEIYAEDALTKDLQRFYRKYGDNHGFIVFLDVHNYFGIIDREGVKAQIAHMVRDKLLQGLFNLFVDAFEDIPEFKDRGMGLGSQISQICGILALNRVDHFITECISDEDGTCRYMDDSYMLFRTYDSADAARTIVMDKYRAEGYDMNEEKCMILPIWESFVWLKKRYRLTETGRVIRKMGDESVRRMRKSIKRSRDWVENGKYSFFQYENIFRSWVISVRKYYDSSASANNIQALFEYECHRLMEDQISPYMVRLSQIMKNNHVMQTVSLIRLGVSHMVFDDDAQVLSGISSVKLRKLKNGHMIASFPEKKLDKYTKLLYDNRISYQVIKADQYDNPKIRQRKHFDASNYDEYVKHSEEHT